MPSSSLAMRSRFCLVAWLSVAAGPAFAQEWPSLGADLGPAGGGENDVAVIVGVSDYFSLPDIPGAADNARDWYQLLTRTRTVPLDRVTILVDADASKEKIEKALKAAAAKARPSGQAFFIFIGHGAPSPSADDGLLLGADTQPDADSLSARGVPQAAVEAMLSAGKQRETVLVFDACFSGRTADGSAPLVDGLQATLPVRKPGTARRAVVLSSSETFAGPLPGAVKRPAFSYLLLGAVRGWADADQSKSVTVEEAFRFTESTMAAALKGSNRLPSMRGPGATVLAVKTVEAAPDIAAILAARCPDGTRWNVRRCEAGAAPAASAASANASKDRPIVFTFVRRFEGMREAEQREIVDDVNGALVSGGSAGLQVLTAEQFLQEGEVVEFETQWFSFAQGLGMRWVIDVSVRDAAGRPRVKVTLQDPLSGGPIDSMDASASRGDIGKRAGALAREMLIKQGALKQ